MASVGDPLRAVQKLRRLDDNVVGFGLDEPVVLGHFYSGANACNYSIHKVARRVALTVRAVLGIYPHAQIGDTESPTVEAPDMWAVDLSHWLDAYKTAAGRPLDEFGMDLLWGRPGWPAAAQHTAAIVRSHGVALSVIITALGVSTDAAWIAQARQHAQQIQALHLLLREVTIASWTSNPTRLGPETDPLTLTGFLAWYIRHYC